MEMFGMPRVGVRSYMSSWALRSAKMCAYNAKQIEEMHEGKWESPQVEEHINYAMTSVVNSVVFLEAMINEIYNDVAENYGEQDQGYLSPIPDNVRKLMASWWEETEGRATLLSKYQMLLSFSGNDKFDKGAEPYQSVASLINFRNAIVHYKPKTIYSDEVHYLEKSLKGKYSPNFLMPENARTSNWWPNNALSAGGAIWSHNKAEAFALALCKKLNIEANYMNQNTNWPMNSK